MVDSIRKKNRTKSRIFTGFVLFLIVVALLSGFLWNKYLDKKSLIESFETSEGQEIVLLGTFHENHFNKWTNYSMADMLHVVENVQPDVVFIEAREASFIDYGVMDGPIDMAVIYSYCIDNDIPVEMVDWWVVDNQYPSNRTSKIRDDMIFTNIQNKLANLAVDKKVLVVCGAGHFYSQEAHFLNNGFLKRNMENKVAYFDTQDIEFEYPASVTTVWTQRAYFYAYTYPEIIEQDETLSDDIKAEFTEGNHDAFYNQQVEYCDLFEKNTLYK